MEKCKLKLSLEEKKSTKIRRRTELHIDNPGATNSFRSVTKCTSREQSTLAGHVVFLRSIYFTRLLWCQIFVDYFSGSSLFTFSDTRTHESQEFVEQNMMCCQTSGQ